MVIRDGENCLEIEVVDRVPANLPTPGDVEVSVAVRSEKYAGQGFAWIDAPTFAIFVSQLRDLEERRQGSAQLEGMSPETFRFRIRSVDRRGHMAIEGMIAKDVRAGESGPYRHLAEFGFEFDPTKLPKIVAEFAKIASG